MKLTPARIARIDRLSYAYAQREPQHMCLRFWTKYHYWTKRYREAFA